MMKTLMTRLMMKNQLLISIFLLISATLTFANNTKTQELKLYKGNYTLEGVIQAISNQSGYVFSYSSKRINPKQCINVKSQNYKNINDLLDRVLPKTISYSIHNKFVILNSVKVVEKPVKAPEIRRVSMDEPKVSTPVDIKPSYSTSEVHETVNTVEIPASSPIAQDTLIKPLTPDKPKEVHIQDQPETPAAPEKKPSGEVKLPKTKPERAVKPQPTKSAIGKPDLPKIQPYVDVELSAYHLFANASAHFGLQPIYGTASYSMDLNSSLIGFGIGSRLLAYQRLSLHAEITDHLIIGGNNFNKGIRVNFVQLRPTVSYRILPNLDVFVGPQCYLLFKNLKDSTSGALVREGQQFGFGATAGIKLDLSPWIFKPNNKQSLARIETKKRPSK
jgi:hypothetical protein